MTEIPQMYTLFSEKIDLFTTALCKVQLILESAKKDSENPFHKNKYADLTSVWSVCRKPLSENGFAVVQSLCGADQTGRSIIMTALLHTSGQWAKSYLHMPSKDQSPQGIGSAITYARRYSLSAIVGIVQEDDDGNQASCLVKEDPEIIRLSSGVYAGKLITEVYDADYLLEIHNHQKASRKLMEQCKAQISKIQKNSNGGKK